MLQSFAELSLGLKPSIMPKQTGVASAAVMFLVPPKGGTIANIQGVETLEKDEHVVLHKIQNCEGRSISTPIDNACYLGHIMTEDRNGLHARGYAEQALKRIVLNFQGEDDDKL